MGWNYTSWQGFKVKHSTSYDEKLGEVAATLRSQPNLVDFESIIDLKNKLSKLEDDNGFIIQMGECAETFAQANKLDTLNRAKLSNEFSNIVAQKGSKIKDVVQIARMAGQYSKPRNEEYERKNGMDLPVYKGDMVNSFEFNKKGREHDSTRMLKAYEKSKITLDFLKTLPYTLYTSHEALILDYEGALSREITWQGKQEFYNASAHFLWLGERTRFLGSGHIEYLRGIANPIGIKISHHCDAQELLQMIQQLNPTNEKGKIALIIRMGANHIEKYFSAILKVVIESKLNVLWMCDPMHGNTHRLKNNFKTRYIDDIIFEIKEFANTLKEYGVYWHGLHLETTYENVGECILKSQDSLAEEKNIQDNYLSYCDPRLNGAQTLDVAEIVFEILNK